MSQTMTAQSIQDFKGLASVNLDQMTQDYINGGAGNEITLHANSSSFDSYFIRPSILSLENSPDCSTTILHHSINLPICIAPTAFHKLFNTHGELATSIAAKNMGTIYTISCLSTTSLSALHKEHDMGHVWVQMLMFKNRSLMRTIIKQAEALGCGALVITVDAPVSGNRKKDLANCFALPPDIRMEILHEHKLFDPNATYNGFIKGSVLDTFFEQNIDPFFGWHDISMIVQSTRLPVILKGILRPEDAQKAYELGVKGVIVSNHGGRQLDGTVPTVLALEKICDTVNNSLEIYVDGGIRTGPDVFKALALGAKAVFLGRPILWGLAAGGQAGVQAVLTTLKKELIHTMYLAGVSRIQNINPQFLWRR